MMISRSSTKLGRAVATAAVAAVVLLQVSPASATSDVGGSESVASESVASGAAFGEHVADCAQGAGFSGTHNPGVHRGARGWDSMRSMPAVA